MMKNKAISTIIGATILFLIMTSSIATITLYTKKTKTSLDVMSLIEEGKIKTASRESNVYIEFSSLNQTIIDGIDKKELFKIIVDHGNGTIEIFDPENNTLELGGKLVIKGKISQYIQENRKVVLVLKNNGHIVLRKTRLSSLNQSVLNPGVFDVKKQVFMSILNDMLEPKDMLSLFLDNNITGPVNLVVLNETLPFTFRIIVENSTLNLITRMCADGGFRLVSWGAEADYLFIVEKDGVIIENTSGTISFLTSAYVSWQTRSKRLSSETYYFNSSKINGTYHIHVSTTITITASRPSQGVYSCTFSFTSTPPTVSLESYYYMDIYYKGNSIPIVIFNPNNTIVWNRVSGTVYGPVQPTKYILNYRVYKNGMYLYYNTTKIFSLYEEVRTWSKHRSYTISNNPTINLYFAEFKKQ